MHFCSHPEPEGSHMKEVQEPSTLFFSPKQEGGHVKISQVLWFQYVKIGECNLLLHTGPVMGDEEAFVNTGVWAGPITLI